MSYVTVHNYCETFLIELNKCQCTITIAATTTNTKPPNKTSSQSQCLILQSQLEKIRECILLHKFQIYIKLCRLVLTHLGA